jgi:hypothetical protein
MSALLTAISAQKRRDTELIFRQSAIDPEILVIDAQNYHEKFDGGASAPSHFWERVADAGSLTGFSMIVNPNIGANYLTTSNINATPTIRFRIRTALAGSAYIWLRCGNISGNVNDSCHVWLNGVLVGSPNGLISGWSTVNRLAVTLPAAGDYDLAIQMREDGFALDRILIGPTSYDAVTLGDAASESPQS